MLLAVPIVVAVEPRKLDWYYDNGCNNYMPPKMKELLGCVPTCDEIEAVLSECLSSTTSCPYVSIQDLNMVGRSNSLCCDDVDEYFDNIQCYSCSYELSIWKDCAKESETFSCVERCEPDEADPEPEFKEESLYPHHYEENGDSADSDDEYAWHPCADKINALSTCVGNSFFACVGESHDIMVQSPCNDYWTTKGMCLLVNDLVGCCPDEILSLYECRGCPLDCENVWDISEQEFNNRVKNGGNYYASKFVSSLRVFAIAFAWFALYI